MLFALHLRAALLLALCCILKSASGFLVKAPPLLPSTAASATHTASSHDGQPLSLATAIKSPLSMKTELCCCGGGESLRRSCRRRPELWSLAAAASSRSPPPKVLTPSSDNDRARLNVERIRQVETGETKTVRAITSSTLRRKLRLKGRDKRGRIFLPMDPQGGALETLNRLLTETFPLGSFPFAFYVKMGLEEGVERSMVTSEDGLLAALAWAEREGLDLNIFVDVHPDYEEEEAPEWLVGVPDPSLAEEWEMLSFYRFVHIDQPDAFANMLQAAWGPLGVRGRVYVASEGINAQMAVPSSSTERFERAVENVEKLQGVFLNRAERRWSGDEFRKNPPFPALHVRARRQIVADGLSEPLEWSDTSGKVGKGLSPEEWHELLDAGNATVLDCRNSYESVVGIFENAVPLDTSFFRESWGELERLVGDANRDAPIMTYCTGGIRCVKIAAYLEQEMGFKNVTRLEGGIVSYSKFAKERGVDSKFKGVNYVFDKRMGDKVTGDMISSCHQCGQPCADHTNCANPCCHSRLIQCQSCAAEYAACCSHGCKEQLSREDLRVLLMRKEREAMELPTTPTCASPSTIGETLLETVKGDVREVDLMDDQSKEEDRLMWLVWPFQDPTLNLMFDRAFDEFRDAARPQENLEDSSRMIGIASRLGGGKQALAVGLGSGGPAGRAGLRQLVEALGEGGSLVAVEASSEAAKAARGLSLVSEARGCSVTVLVCDEGSIFEHMGEVSTEGTISSKGVRESRVASEAGESVPRSPVARGLFDVILIGGGSWTGAVETVPVGKSDGEETRVQGRSPAERLDLVLDRRLIKRTGLVLCDPCALVGGEAAAASMLARAREARGTVEHSRVSGVGPSGGLHMFKWKTYSH